LSSFRPVLQPDPSPAEPPVKQVITIIPKAPAPPPGTQPKPTGTLKAVRQPNTSSQTTSVYTRQDTIEQLEEQLSGPNIPDPDYSSDEDQDVQRNRDLSTFKANKQTMSTSDRVPDSVGAASAGHRMTQSFAEKLPKSATNNTNNNNNTSKGQLAFGDELKAQTQKIMSKSMANQSTLESKDKSFERKGYENDDKSNDNSNSDSNNSTNVSKVRKNIREFERRSSICGDTTVPPVVPALQHKKEPTVTSANIHSNTNDSNSNSMRMSKSCFEVDCCDNSSSGKSYLVVLYFVYIIIYGNRYCEHIFTGIQ
jgi:hypothetical protein